MTTARIFGVARGSRFECSPLDVTQWRWGEIKGGDSDIEIATLALTDGTHLRMSYESVAPRWRRSITSTSGGTSIRSWKSSSNPSASAVPQSKD